MISRYHLLQMKREGCFVITTKTQAVEGIEEAEILKL